MRTTLLLVAILAAPACTTLGPTPMVTGVSAVPAPRGSVEAQVGAVPGHYLSAATAEEAQGAALGQVAAVFDLGERAPGLVFGGRVVGPSHDNQAEPVIGYRKAIERRTALAGFVSGTHASGEQDGASYEATRVHVEIAGDIQVTADNRWAELHVIGGASAAYLSASGRYCVDPAGEHGVTCGEPPEAMTDAELSGVYPSANAGVALHLFRHRDGTFHGARVMAMFGAGLMPRVVAGTEDGSEAYAAAGLALSLSFGESR